MKKSFLTMLVACTMLLSLQIGAVERGYRGLMKKFEDRYNEMKEKAQQAITDDNFHEARSFLKKATMNQEVLTMLKEERHKGE